MNLFDDNFFINIAPMPAAGMGMGRFVVRLDGEKVVQLDPHIGFSHRGMEKIMEQGPILQGLVYVDKLNRSAPFSCTHAFVRAVEQLAGITVPERASYIRVILAETGRILSHLRATANLAAETGTDSVYPLVNRMSERIYALADELCGTCSPALFIRPGGVKDDLTPASEKSLSRWLFKEMPPLMAEIEDLLTENRIFKSRTEGIGKIDGDQATAMGFSGVNLRACGIRYDLRTSEPYEIYDRLSFDIPVRTTGDCYARYSLRIFEIYQSLRIIRQALEKMPQGEVMSPEFGISDLRSLTQLSRHFELYGKGTPLPAGEVYAAVEAPPGEFGVFLVSDGSPEPYRCHFRSAGFPVMQALSSLTEGRDLADVRVIAASLNMIMTEIDR